MSQGDTSGRSGGAAHAPLAYVPHLPALRPPPGWGVLDEAALRIRAAQLFQSCVPVIPADAGAAEAPDRPHRDSRQALDEPLAPAPAHGEARRPSVGQWLGWPLLLLLAGLAALAPWLVWAPLIGGLCAGILVLQTGLLARWLSFRHARRNLPSHPGTPGGAAEEEPVAATAGAAHAATVPQRRPRRHSGWLLVAALVLVSVQAALLIATLEIRRADPMLRAVGTQAAPDRGDTAQTTGAHGAPRVRLPQLPAGGGVAAGEAGEGPVGGARP